MNILEQVSILEAEHVEFVVVGGQAGVLRQAIEFSHDLDVIIRTTRGQGCSSTLLGSRLCWPGSRSVCLRRGIT